MRFAKSATILLTCLFAATAVHAEKDGKDAKRMQQMLRKLEHDKAQLEREKGEAEARVKETEAKAEEAAKHANARNAALSRQLKAAEEETASLKTALDETSRKLAEQSEARRKAEAEDSRLGGALAVQEKATSACEAKNAELYRYGQEMSARYENKDAIDALLQAEPFTGLKRVEVENLLEEYRDKLDAQKIEPKALPRAAGR